MFYDIIINILVTIKVIDNQLITVS